jgi:hypothetical protein
LGRDRHPASTVAGSGTDRHPQQGLALRFARVGSAVPRPGPAARAGRCGQRDARRPALRRSIPWAA